MSEDDKVTPAGNDSPDATATLLRLLVGGAVEGTDLVLRVLTPSPCASESGDAEKSDAGNDPAAAILARQALIGLLFEAYGAASRGATAAGRIATTAGRFWGSVLSPVARSRTLAPVRLPYDLLVEIGSRELHRWARIGRAEEERSREVAGRITRIPVDDIVAYLRDNPEVEEMVRRQAQSLIDDLADDPRLAEVIREQGDRYIEHLQENSEAIRELVQSQSAGLASEVADSVRARTVTADTLLERFVRSVLRRRPREELDGAPPKVREQAEYPRNHGDD
jgi:hypothetical protein